MKFDKALRKKVARHQGHCGYAQKKIEARMNGTGRKDKVDKKRRERARVRRKEHINGGRAQQVVKIK